MYGIVLLQVNDAEKERYESQLEHQTTAAVFNEEEQMVNELQKNLKRSIMKSRSVPASVSHIRSADQSSGLQS